ncbi:MAG: M48 family metallopeptidase [Treponemataceae bacterium]|nr:M48 family metallopeptidase [Treponemataceae bacterium]
METQFWFFMIVLVYALFSGLSFVVDVLNLRYRRPEVANKFEGFIDQEQYNRLLSYNREKDLFQVKEGIVSFTVLLLFLLFRGPGVLDSWIKTLAVNPFWRGLIFFGVLYLFSVVLELPFKAYFDFSLEARYGFNTKTWRIFLADELKGLLISALLGSLVWYLFYVTFEHLGPLFPLVFGIIIWILVVLISSLYTTLIVPLFNKLTPLPEGPLTNAIAELAAKTGFPLGGIYVMNASQRSRKSNAYFSGLGRFKKIVLFDTLLEQHNTEEILSILAHEIGHYKKGHIRWNLFFSGLSIFITLAVLSVILTAESLSFALGGTSYGLHLNVFAFFILYTPLTVMENLILLAISRHFEYEADAFAVAHTSPLWYSRALKKLFVQNLSDLYPHPWYVLFHYSHPPVLERLAAVEKVCSREEPESELVSELPR